MLWYKFKDIGCRGWIWTTDLRVMSPTSYHCSTPRWNLSGWGKRIRTSGWLDQNQLPYRLAIPQPVKRKVIIYIFTLFVKLFGKFSPFFQSFSIKAVLYEPFKRLFISSCQLAGSASSALNLGNKSKFSLGLKNSLFICITLRAFSLFCRISTSQPALHEPFSSTL